MSGANQYTETLPGAGGNEPTSGAGAHHGGANENAKALGQANAERLESLGPEGEAAANLAASGATTNPTAHTHGIGNATGVGSESDGRSALSQVLGSLTGSSGESGMGMLLPLLIIAMVFAAVGFAIRRRRASD